VCPGMDGDICGTYVIVLTLPVRSSGMYGDIFMEVASVGKCKTNIKGPLIQRGSSARNHVCNNHRIIYLGWMFIGDVLSNNILL